MDLSEIRAGVGGLKHAESQEQIGHGVRRIACP